MGFIDTHTHIYTEEFDTDRHAACERAKAAGADKLFLPNIDRASLGPMLALCDAHPDLCYPMMGLHPTEIPPDFETVLREMESLLQAPGHPYIAIGEVGLDFYWDDSHKTEQQYVFERQIDWSIRYGLPLVIHARSAHRELTGILDKYRDSGLSGVFHCFGGTLQEAEELLSFSGFVLGIGGILTFKKSTLPDVLHRVPLSRLVLETDSPYLAPVPHRGKRNESAYIPFIADKLAEVYGLSPEQIIEQTSATALRIFPKAGRRTA